MAAGGEKQFSTAM